MNAPLPNDEDKPLDPATEKVRKKLARYGAVFMGFNILALMAVLGAIVYKLSARDEVAANQAAPVSNASVPVEDDFEGVIDIPDGARLVSATRSGDQILLTLGFSASQSAIWIYDISEARVIGKLEIK